MIKIKNLTFQYSIESKVINHINLKINKNEKIAIVGKSGCGKTTLLFLLASILKPISGEIIIDNEKLMNMRRNTGIIFQNGGLFPWKNVEDNLKLGLKNVSKEEMNNKVIRVLEELEILDLRYKYLKQLSGGQKQRVAIGRVLVSNSDLLLLDEPSSSLDAMTKDNFQKTMLKLYKKHQLTSIIVTHDIEEAVYLGEKIIIMKNGRVDEVIENPLFGNEEAKNSMEFYQKCIELRQKVN